MAVTATFTRVSHSQTTPFSIEVCSVALAGTYTTGGFTTNPYGIQGSAGSSPLPSRSVRAVQWISPSGYMYASTVVGTVMTTKIYSAPGTELANGTAVPDAVATSILYLGK